ncbi:hypothetical protein [Microbacterium sp.]|uniref:hypothetical protein n=1 Tax=Microbacterium sp. TaxID=51671 RepID=UPI003C77D3FA
MTDVRMDAERAARARASARWVGLIVPIAILLISGGAVLAWLPDFLEGLRHVPAAD